MSIVFEFTLGSFNKSLVCLDNLSDPFEYFSFIFIFRLLVIQLYPISRFTSDRSEEHTSELQSL